MLTLAEFLAIFPEFSNATTYPVARVNFWLSYAVNFVDSTRWGNVYQQGMALYAAHLLVLDVRNQSQQGTVTGVDTGQSADGISYSVDSASVTIAGAGLYNTTTYGIQYWQLAQMMGAGGLQVAC